LSDERLAEFQQAMRQAVKSGKRTVSASEKVAKKAGAQAKKARPKQVRAGDRRP
jgi:hypothetical protein